MEKGEPFGIAGRRRPAGGAAHRPNAVDQFELSLCIQPSRHPDGARSDVDWSRRLPDQWKLQLAHHQAVAGLGGPKDVITRTVCLGHDRGAGGKRTS